ncbi:MAG: hypothetical protein EU539_10630 [Promethearchaeota archaeon]|nr:MAG: hypothetical protein EU539_10630 [Candidatus Lokiarchaeota archaeon]
MVDVRGDLRFAFSTVFAPHENFDPKNLKIDSRMFPGFQEERFINNFDELEKQKDRRIVKAVKKIKEKIGERRLKLAQREGPLKIFLVKRGLSPKDVSDIVEKTKMDNLGLFLECIDLKPKEIADKLNMNNQEELLEYMRMARKSIDLLKNTIKDPASVVKSAIMMCFELFQISKDTIKKYDGEDGEILYIDDLREVSISFRPNNEIEELEYLEFVDPEKRFGFEVDWVIYNVDNNRWINILQKVAVVATTSLMQYIIPRVSATIGSLIKNAIKHKTDEILIAGCNMDIRLIFHELLRVNLAIEYIKFQQFEANIWNEDEKQALLTECGKNLIRNPEIVDRGIEIMGDIEGLRK